MGIVAGGQARVLGACDAGALTDPPAEVMAHEASTGRQKEAHGSGVRG